MKLKDLLDVCLHKIELHSSRDGSLVASSRKTMEEYGEAEVRGIFPKIKVDKHSQSASPYLYVYVSPIEISQIKEAKELEKCECCQTIE